MKTPSGLRLITPPAARRVLAGLGLAAGLYAASSSLLAQDAATPEGQNNRRRADGGERGDRGDRRNMSPQDLQARMLTALRERLEVTDDEEWKLISEKLAKVTELRRGAGGGFGGFGGPGFGGRGGDNGNRGGDTAGRGGRGGGSPEVAALQEAVRDKLPDAEIKSRLERLRETRKENEMKLTKAQEELRAVLTLRQEAMLVSSGLLP